MSTSSSFASHREINRHLTRTPQCASECVPSTSCL